MLFYEMWESIMEVKEHNKDKYLHWKEDMMSYLSVIM